MVFIILYDYYYTLVVNMQPIPDEKSIINAELKIGDSTVLLSDEFHHGCCLSC
jgi:hypothetical protein